MRVSLLVLVMAVCLLVQSQTSTAAILFDGNGSPAAVGYVGGSGDYTFDSPSPGLMTQNNPSLTSGLWLQTSASELNSAAGWFFEARVDVAAAEIVDPPFPRSAAVLAASTDETGLGAQISFEPDRISLVNDNFQVVGGISVPHGSGFHTARVERLPGAGNIVVTIDGVLIGQLAAYTTGEPATRLDFGSGFGGGNAVWDYMHVNAAIPTPEPSSIVLLAVAGIGFAAYRRRRHRS